VLYRYALDDPAVRIDGALALRVAPGTVTPGRLPEGALAQIDDPFFRHVAGMTAGVRVVFRSAADSVSLTMRCTGTRLDDIRMVPAIDLVVDGVPSLSKPVTGGDTLGFDGGIPTLAPGRPVTIDFTGLGSRDKAIELWLPHSAACELIELAADAPIRAAPPDERPVWLHHGSSISHCLEAPTPTSTWPVVAAALGDRRLLDLGFAGNAVLDPFVARAIRDTPADLISLKLGINIVAGALMRERTFAPAVSGFLDTVREGHPDTPILVISPLACPALENASGPCESDALTGEIVALGSPSDGALTLSSIRRMLARIVEARSRTDPGIRYLDGLTLLGLDEAADLPDGLHPSPDAYTRMGERFARAVFGR
jgi:hypothetical protein